jgi:hypothetical protein
LAHVPETASRSSQRRLRRQGIPADQPCVHGTDMGALCRVRCRSIGIIARRRTLDRVFDERISFCVEKMGGHRLPSESARLRPAAGKRFPYPADGECSWHVTFRERVGAGRHLLDPPPPSDRLIEVTGAAVSADCYVDVSQLSGRSSSAGKLELAALSAIASTGSGTRAVARREADANRSCSWSGSRSTRSNARETLTFVMPQVGRRGTLPATSQRRLEHAQATMSSMSPPSRPGSPKSSTGPPLRRTPLAVMRVLSRRLLPTPPASTY